MPWAILPPAGTAALADCPKHAGVPPKEFYTAVDSPLPWTQSSLIAAKLACAREAEEIEACSEEAAPSAPRPARL